MKAIITLDKESRKLLPKNSKTPNALVNFFNKPILEYTIDLLKKNNIIEIAILTRYPSDDIKTYFQDGSNFGIDITYFDDQTPLSEIKNFCTDDNFLVASGTFLADINLYEAIEFHNNKHCMATAVVTNTPQVVDATVVQSDKEGEVTSFLVVKEQNGKFPKNISTGIFILEKEVLGFITEMPKDILQFLLKENIECYLTTTKGNWYGVAVLEQYLNCNKLFNTDVSDIVNTTIVPQIKFSNGAIMGDCSETLTPIMATKIGEIFGEKNSIVGVFTDDNSASEMITSSIIAGLKSVGSTVYEYSNTIAPLCNIACTYYTLSKGIFVYTDGSNTMIEFLDKDGSRIDIKSQKEIEDLLYKNETQYVAPNEIQKSMHINNYKFHYYSELIKRLNDDPIQTETNIILEKTSESVLEYIRKLAICYKVNLISTKNASSYRCIKVNIHPAGKKIKLWDETGYMLSERQIEAIIAKILCDEKITNHYIVSPNSSQAIKSILEDSHMNIIEINGHISQQTKAMLSMVDKEQFFMTNDPVYFIFKLINYLNKNKIKLKALISTLPKMYMIEKTIKNKNGTITIENLADIAKDEAKIIDGIVKINSKKGYTTIIPNSENSSFKISTESTNEEFAKELTDFYTNSLL